MSKAAAAGDAPWKWEDRVIVFLGLAGSRRYKEEHGIVQGLLAVKEHGRIVRETLRTRCQCSNPDAHLVKYVGDEVMLVFPKDEAALALQCVMESIEGVSAWNDGHPDAPMQSKAGITLGKVVLRLHEAPREARDDPHGLPTDLAACLVAMAKPGQILVDQAYRNLVATSDIDAPSGELVGFVPLSGRAKRLKGIGDLVTVSEVLWNGEEQAIKNKEGLRTELKKLEEALTDLILQKDYISRQTEKDLGEGDQKSLTQARERLEALNADGKGRGSKAPGPLAHVLGVYAESSEAPFEGDIAELVETLVNAYDGLMRGLNKDRERRRRLLSDDQEERRGAVSDCGDDVAQLFEAAQNLQIAADKYIRRVDGS